MQNDKHQHEFEAQMAPEDGVTYYEMCECGATLAVMPTGFEVVYSKDMDAYTVLGAAKTQGEAEAMLYRFSEQLPESITDEV